VTTYIYISYLQYKGRREGANIKKKKKHIDGLLIGYQLKEHLKESDQKQRVYIQIYI